jgi:hypothetical protein
MVNRLQALVLGFFLLAWVSLAAILALAPDVYDQSLRLPPADRGPIELGFLGALSVFIAVLCVGVLRRWRWTFWLVLVAFLFGVLRVPASVLELTGWLPTANPSWYAVLQGFIGLVQFGIGLLMLADYRRSGVWGPS